MAQTKHKPECERVFNRYDLTCDRCVELNAGAKARPGWSDNKRREERQTLAAIRAHDFRACERANVVCTHFDW